MMTLGIDGIKLHVLVDSGSSHNFIDSWVAKALKLMLITIQLIAVEVSGHGLECTHACPRFLLENARRKLSSQFLDLPFGGT